MTKREAVKYYLMDVYGFGHWFDTARLQLDMEADGISVGMTTIRAAVRDLRGMGVVRRAPFGGYTVEGRTYFPLVEFVDALNVAPGDIVLMSDTRIRTVSRRMFCEEHTVVSTVLMMERYRMVESVAGSSVYGIMFRVPNEGVRL